MASRALAVAVGQWAQCLRRLMVLTWMVAVGGVAAEEVPLVFGVLNQQSPQLTAERWNPILGYLQRQTGLEFQLRLAPTVQATNARMANGEFDLLFTNHNFRPMYDGTYRVLARWGDKAIFGVIAVPKDSPIKTLVQLRGKRVAYPSDSAFVAYAVPKVALRAAGVQDEEVFAGNQEGALAQLAGGLVDAAGVNSRYLTQYAARKNFAYREIFTSEPFPDLAVVVHPRVPAAQADAVRAALLRMKDDPEAQSILDGNQFSGFWPATERDYDGVRRAYRLLGP
ncbi:MAG: phosphate/phosphite/phosphonate ABC transporter substrate-binding protein [Zoogloeaceae bacterium]|nr:phosphate/phosphite/phosphonate ABC transporter substrate-binding protein [Zoogloeaceae bacterium]